MPILEDFRNRATDRLIPFQATLELTYHCNARCGHCYLSAHDDSIEGKTPLKLHEWKNILTQLADAGTFYLVFTGGEAMLHPDFWDIAEYASNLHFALSLITNGSLLDEAAADRVRLLGFTNVTFSLYSLNPGIHDQMTGYEGLHAKVLAAIDILAARGVRVGINCLLTRHNIESYFELEEWAKLRGFEINFDPMVTAKTDGGLSSLCERASSDQLSKFYAKLHETGRNFAPISVHDADRPVCNAGHGKCAISVHGDLLTCLEIREPVGNLKEKNFKELWFSSEAERSRSYKNRDLKFDLTRGDGAFCDHCPGMAGAEAGDCMAGVPFVMEIARFKRQVVERK